MKGFFVFLSSLVLIASGCSRAPRVLGQKPAASPVSINSVKTSQNLTTVSLRGVIVEKCPVAGCWFYLRDQTGTIKVDTKAANFVVVEIPLNTTVVVSGKVSTEGSERILEASGLEY